MNKTTYDRIYNYNTSILPLFKQFELEKKYNVVYDIMTHARRMYTLTRNNKDEQILLLVLFNKKYGKYAFIK